VGLFDNLGRPIHEAGVRVWLRFRPGKVGDAATAQTDARGIATFTHLAVPVANGSVNYLSVSSPGLSPLVSGPIRVEGSLVRLKIDARSTLAAGGALTAQVQLLDASGDPLRQAGVRIDLSLLTHGFTLQTARAATDRDGVATVSSLKGLQPGRSLILTTIRHLGAHAFVPLDVLPR
jgi:hypothetical protein